MADYDVDPEQRRVTAKVDRVDSIVHAYLDTPSDSDRDIHGVEDLFDEATGLPR